MSSDGAAERRMNALSRRLDYLEERLSEAEEELAVLRMDRSVPVTPDTVDKEGDA